MDIPLKQGRKGLDFVGLAVVYFCHDGKGNFVMQKRGKSCRDEQGKWDVGAGSVDFEDSVEKTLKKEIMEEYGAEVLEFEFLGYRDVFRDQEGAVSHWLTLDFKVLVDPKQVTNGEPHKFDEIKWVTKDSLFPTEEMHSQLPYILEKYKGKL